MLNGKSFPMVMIKILPRKYAEAFVKHGQVHFSKPSQWAREGERGELVRGDALEGCFAATEGEDEFLASLYDDVDAFDYQGLVRYRRRRSEDLAVFCLYGLLQADFDQEKVNGLGITEHHTSIPKLFFDSFSGDIPKQRFLEMPEEDRPAAIIITRPEVFLERLASSVQKTLMSFVRLHFGMVNYVDKSLTHLICEPHPRELLYKSLEYSYQHEMRYMIEADQKRLDTFFEQTGGNVELGPLDDIAKLEVGYYFEDVPMMVDDRGLIYPLSVPETEKIGYLRDMTLSEVVGWYFILSEFHARYCGSTNEDARKSFEEEIVKRTGAKSIGCDALGRRVIINAPDDPEEVTRQARIGNPFFENN